MIQRKTLLRRTQLTGAVLALLLVALFLLPSALVEAAPPQFPGVQLIDAWPDVEFQEPIHVTHAGDGSDFLYVLEQPGKVKRIKKYRGAGSVPQPTLFLDLRSRVYAKSQGGLLCMAFHPRFRSNRLFYVSYLASNPNPGPQGMKFKLVIAEYRSAGAKADLSSARIVMEIPKVTAQHQGGCIGFGPDGMLYIGIGDGNVPGAMTIQKHPSQDANQYLGKVLRIDPGARMAGNGYGIPRGNPWPNTRGVRPEIWGFGFRNPWRFSWDSRGRMWTVEPGSTGPESREWLLEVKYGGNHGWPFMEGTRVLKPVPASQRGRITPRTFEYVRGAGNSTAGIGGFVYRGDRVKALKGKYVFGDYMSGEIYAVDLQDAGKRVVGRNFKKVGDVPDMASLGEDEQGELYMCSNGDLGVVFTLAPNP